jgi:hypothetical protein
MRKRCVPETLETAQGRRIDADGEKQQISSNQRLLRIG